MSVLSALQSASVKVIKRRPGAFYTSSQPFEIEMADLANDAARDIAEGHSWQRLMRFHTIAGDGVATEFPLPADYSRMSPGSEIGEPGSWSWGYDHVVDLTEFERIRSSAIGAITPGAWTIYGGSMHFTPAPAGGAIFPYVSKNFVMQDGGDMADRFEADNDEFLIDDGLLMLAILYRWRAQNQLPYEADFGNFNRRFGLLAARDRGAYTIRSGPGARHNAGRAFPWALV